MFFVYCFYCIVFSFGFMVVLTYVILAFVYRCQSTVNVLVLSVICKEYVIIYCMSVVLLCDRHFLCLYLQMLW
jgi:hypothetical protein